MKAHKLAIAMIAAGLALVWAIGGWAMAGTRHASPAKVAAVTHPATVRSATVKHVKAATTATDTDSVQSGDQTGIDTPAEVAGETSSETTTAEEPGDANLPGGGHADPAGQNVQHEFNGVE